MNNNNTPAIIRTLIIYAVCIPLAVWIGFMLADPFDLSTFKIAGVFALVLCSPILLRWHHFLLVTTWNLGMTIFFLPGKPPIWLLVTALSLGLSVLHRTINDKARFLSAPSITWPLVFFIAVVVFTGKMTGGFGLHSLGDEVAGGKFYVLLVMGILGYFALTAQQIPPKRVKLYVSLFFLAGCSSLIGDLAPFIPSSFYFIFQFFPLNGKDLVLMDPGAITNGDVRFIGIGWMGEAVFFFMLARYGVRGIFLSGRVWRPLVFLVFAGLSLMGGFRSQIILCGCVFLIQCYLEKLHQSRAFPAFILAGVVAVTLIVAFANKLPFSVQRSLAFLPLKLDPVAVQTAEATEEWRLGIWKDALLTVPQYLLLGKGYAISAGDLAVANNEAFHYASDLESVEISGNYHSGPLSTVIPFGAWGVIALVWFWIASLRALYLNYRYGDAEFRTINIFFLAYFISRVFEFLIIFGGLYGDMYNFTAIVGLSVSINGGIRQPVKAPVQAANKTVTAPPARPRFQPFYQS